MIKLQLHPTDRMMRQFAWASLIVFPLFAWSLGHRLGVGAWTWALGALGPLLFVAEYTGLRAVSLTAFRVLILVTFPIGLVVFPVLIAVLYYGIFTPIGLVMRLLGRDVMKASFDPKASSYWHERGPARPAASYFKLY
jgi:hypothetical protein